MLIGLGKMVKKIGNIPSVLTLLASKILGYTHITVPGGSGYYTTTVGSKEGIFITRTNVAGLIRIDQNGDTSATLTDKSIVEIRSIDDKFYALDTSGYMHVSSDGVTWTSYNTYVGSLQHGNAGFAYANNSFYINTATQLYFSRDGVTWESFTPFAMPLTYTEGPSTYPAYFSSMYSDGTVIVMTARTNVGSTYGFLIRMNSLGNWYCDTVQNYFGYNSIYYSSISKTSDGVYYFKEAEYYNGSSWVGIFLYSYNGVNWNVSPGIMPYRILGMEKAADGRYYIALPNGYLYSSSLTLLDPADIVTFSTSYSQPTKVALCGDTFIRYDGAEYGTHTYQISSDGVNWSEPRFASFGMRSIININDMYIGWGMWQVGYTRDLQTWTICSNISTVAGFSATLSKNTLREIQTAIGNQGTTGAEILAPVDVYTVPALTQTRLKRVETKNLSNNTITYDLAIMPSNLELSEFWSTKWDAPINAGATDTVLPDPSMDPLYAWITMYEGYSVKVLPSAVDAVQVKVYGDEVKLPVFVIGQLYNNGNGIQYSTDGSVWKKATDYNAQSLKYNNGLFTASGFGAQFWSEDAINWTQVPTARAYMQSMYGEKYLAWNTTGGYTGLIYSQDGKTWTELANGIDYRTIYYLNGKYIASTNDATKFVTSSNGISWSEISFTNALGFGQTYNAPLVKNVAYGNGKYVIVHNYQFAYSSDGITWTEISPWQLQPEDVVSNIVFFNNKFYISGNVYGYSEDGVNWTIDRNKKYKIIDIANNKMFIQEFGTYPNSYVRYSNDGSNFVDTQVNTNYHSVDSAIYAGGNYVIMDNYGHTYSSNNLSSWTDVFHNDYPTHIAARP